jgi:hypothetical protein
VYFIYPETAGVRLEDMDALFGDATAVQTPATLRGAEGSSLLGASSPVPSMDLRRGVKGAGYANSPSYNANGLGPSSAIPGLDIDPPHVNIKNGKPQYSGPEEGENQSEGVGGWISRMVRRAGDDGSGRSGTYKPLEQDEA